MPLRFYNSLTRSIEDFAPLSPPKVGLYTCGPTVYNYLHVGNYRTYIFEDVLRRTLKFSGYSVRHVMNITDVGHLTSQADEGEDKMEVGARREGKTAWEIAKFYERTFLEDAALLNLDFGKSPDDILCRATQHIPAQIELIRRLEKSGFAYRISDGIYFDTAKFKPYGRLTGGAHIEGIQEGVRVQVNREKRNPTDFALWKFAPKGERQMEWESPWGWGFPGWHIECSAMAMKYLGESFDIHCGGVDHIPIHHANEIAQAEAATGKPFVRVWMHGEFLVLNKAKMAKSAGTFIRLQDLIAKGFDPLDYRYLCLTAHYRKQLDFSWESLEAAKTARARLKEKFLEAKGLASRGKEEAPARERESYAEHFRARLADDLDMPGALAALHQGLSSCRLPADHAQLIEMAEKIFALGLAKETQALPPDALKLFEEYKAARARKDFSQSDKLRKLLLEKGIQVLDSKESSRWKRL